MRQTTTLVLIGSTLFFTACGGGGSTGGGTNPTTTPSTPPHMTFNLKDFIENSTYIVDLEGTVRGKFVKLELTSVPTGKITFQDMLLNLKETELIDPTFNSNYFWDQEGTYLGNTYYMNNVMTNLTCYNVEETKPEPIPTHVQDNYTSDIMTLTCDNGYNNDGSHNGQKSYIVKKQIKLNEIDKESVLITSISTIYKTEDNITTTTKIRVDEHMNILSYKIYSSDDSINLSSE